MKRVLVVALGLFSLANAVRLVQAIQQMQLEQTGQLPAGLSAIPAAYLAAISLIWAVAFGFAAVNVARSRSWAARVTIAVIVLYQANLWLNHVAFTRSAEAEARVGFAALLSAGSIAAISIAALIVDRAIRKNTMTNAPAQPSVSDSNS